MKFMSTRLITADVTRLVNFYEKVTETSAVWGNELFAEIPTPVQIVATRLVTRGKVVFVSRDIASEAACD